MLSRPLLCLPPLVGRVSCVTKSSPLPASHPGTHTSDLRMSSSLAPQKINDIAIISGLPHITVTLPSRAEKCVFSLKPISHTVGDFLDMLRHEDKGIDRAVIKNTSGVRVASATSIQTLFDSSFLLCINDTEYLVEPPVIEGLSKEELKKISDVKNLVSQLYEALNIDEYQLKKEKDIVEELEFLQAELQPLEEQRRELIQHAEARTNSLTWVGLGLMSVQFGILARLTWWEYSWDIMEPVTYFVTYGTAIAMYAYFVLTREEYAYPSASDRQRLVTFHKKAKKHRWDVDRYNKLQQDINSLEADLRKIRDPLQMHVSSLSNNKKVETKTSLFGISNLRDVINKLQ